MKELEKRVLWRIFGPKMEEVTGGWRTLQLKSSVICTPNQNISRIIESKFIWAEQVSLVQEG
jgi:hypothetical protein